LLPPKRLAQNIASASNGSVSEQVALLSITQRLLLLPPPLPLPLLLLLPPPPPPLLLLPPACSSSSSARATASSDRLFFCEPPKWFQERPVSAVRSHRHTPCSQGVLSNYWWLQKQAE
jgi:hypothetical protein